MSKIPYKHPIVREYQDKYSKDTEKNSELSKSRIEEKLLKQFGIETSYFCCGTSIDQDSELVNSGKRKILLDHLEKCNIVLNDKKYVDLRLNLLNETKLILKSVFPEPKFNDEEYFRMAEDVLYLMSHRHENHHNGFPRHAQSLKDALKTGLLPNGDNTPKSLELIRKEVEETYDKETTAATNIQKSYKDYLREKSLRLSQPVYEKIHHDINEYLPPDQYVSLEEIQLIMYRIKLVNPKNLPVFLSKSVTKFSHSILIYKGENGYVVLIKPAVKNDQEHFNKRNGTNKDVKTSGVQIRFDIDKELKSIQRVVTVSRTPSSQAVIKDESLEQMKGDDLIADGFTKVVFNNHTGTSRILYTKRYLGEDLLFLKDELDYPTKVIIAQQLLRSFNWSIGDIKLENTLWNGRRATFIDAKDMVFTFTTRNDRYKGDYSRARPQEIRKQQIFGLCCLLYDLFAAKDHRLSGHGFKEPSKKNKNINLDRNSPFARFVQRAYDEQLDPFSGLQELKNHVSDLESSERL